MNVLLLGEFSSLHRYLKEGLHELGEEVSLYANGDGWKQIGGADGPLYVTQHSNVVQKVNNVCIDPFQKAQEFKGYDVVQLIHPQMYSSLINTRILNKIDSQNNCLSLVAAGRDYALNRAYKSGRFDYYMYDFDPESLQMYSPSKLSGCARILSEKSIVKRADIIIPSLYEYTVGYQGYEKLHSVIPFPINLKGIEYRENRLREKLVFFHGLNREAAKGTPFIRAALERLQEDYPNDVEVVIDGKMPFDKYISVMQRSNVVIDQCCSYGYGINACIAMAQGKVVMSGSRSETLNAFGIDSSPIIQIRPDVEQIYTQLKNIVENRALIPLMGQKSREYVENMHDHVQVAQQYLEAWKSTGKV